MGVGAVEDAEEVGDAGLGTDGGSGEADLEAGGGSGWAGVETGGGAGGPPDLPDPPEGLPPPDPCQILPKIQAYQAYRSASVLHY